MQFFDHVFSHCQIDAIKIYFLNVYKKLALFDILHFVYLYKTWFKINTPEVNHN